MYAAAKSFQSYPTLCDPIDSSPPGSTVPGIFQARTLECIAISFSNAWKWKVKVKSLSRVWLSDPMDCNPPGSSIHGIFQARVLEWVAIAFSVLSVYTHIFKPWEMGTMVVLLTTTTKKWILYLKNWPVYSSISQFGHYSHIGLNNPLLWGCPAHCRRCSSIPGLYPLDAGTIHISPVVTTENASWLTNVRDEGVGGKTNPI